MLSVNRSPGAGITVSSPTGNIIITANIACVQFSTSTLSLSRSPTQNPTAQNESITASSQTIYINLPTTVSNVDIINLTNTLISNTVNVNLSLNGNVGNFSGNISGSNLSTGGILTVTGNANVANIGAENGVFTSNVTVTTNVTAGNIYANSGTLGAVNVNASGNLNSANANLGNLAVANYFQGDGSLISNVVSVPGPKIVNGTSYTNIATINGNVVTVVNSNTILTVTDTGANITGTANLSGNLSAANANLGNLVIANYFQGNFYGIANSASTAGTVTTNAQPNITSVGTLTSLDVTGNITSSNIYANSGTIGASLLSGTLTTSAQPNITSTGTLTGLGVNGTVTATNINANTGVFTGNGSGLSQLVGANVTGTVANATYATSAGSATTAGTVTTNAQPNITSTGTLSSLDVSGTITAANITANTGVFAGNGSGLSAITGANVTGIVANATYATSAGSATTAATVTTTAQPNITSVGTLTSLDVTGNITSSNVYANAGTIGAQYLKGDGSNITNISVGAGSYITNGSSNVTVDANANVNISVAGNANVVTVTGTGANVAGYANVTGNVNAGNVTATLLTGTLTTAAQPNITSHGTLTELTVAGISNLGSNSNVIITGGVSGSFLKTNGAGNLVWDTATLVPAQGSNAQVIFNDGGSTYAGNANLTFNKTTGALAVGGNLSTMNVAGGNLVSANYVSGTLTTTAQPNITSVGSLLSLIVNGNINSGNASLGNLTTSNYFAGTLTTAAQPNITSVGTLTSLGINGTVTAVAFTANTGVFTGNGSGLSHLVGANVSGTVANATYATSAGSTTTAGTVTTNAQPNITSVGSLSALIVSGNINVGNVYANSGTIGASSLSGTLTTVAQPNITSVGTLTSLGVNGTVTAVAFTANTGVFTGNGSGLSQIVGANVAGTVANATSAGSATTAGTVTTAAQPNITSVGNLSTLTVIGNTFLATTSGNVGIGTTSPSAKLDVRGNIDAASSSTSHVRVAMSGGVGSITSENAGTQYEELRQTGQFVSFYTGQFSASERMRIDSSGNVGIGTTSPTFRFVAANSTTDGVWAYSSGAVSTVGFGGYSSATDGAFHIKFDRATGAATFNGGTRDTPVERMRIDANGNVGIGTSAPADALSVNGSIRASLFYVHSVTTFISAAGTTQATATALTTDFNVVSTVTAGQGVSLPTAVAGYRITILNTSATALNVYPLSNGQINAAGTNVPYSLSAGAKLDFICIAAAAAPGGRWYTIG